MLLHYKIKYKKKEPIEAGRGEGVRLYRAKSSEQIESSACVVIFRMNRKRETWNMTQKKKKAQCDPAFPTTDALYSFKRAPSPDCPGLTCFLLLLLLRMLPFKKKELLNFLVSSLQFKLINTRLLVFIITSRVRWYDVRVSYCCPGKRDVAPALRTFFFKP